MSGAASSQPADELMIGALILMLAAVAVVVVAVVAGHPLGYLPAASPEGCYYYCYYYYYSLLLSSTAVRRLLLQSLCEHFDPQK